MKIKISVDIPNTKVYIIVIGKREKEGIMLTTAERQEVVKEYITREGIVSTDIPAQLERVVIYAAVPQIFTLMGTDISLFETIVRSFRNTYVDAYADGIVKGVLLAKS